MNDAGIFLKDNLISNTPFAVGKIGVNELRAVENYLLNNTFSFEAAHKLYINNGIFPATNDIRIKFVKELISTLQYIDALPNWCVQYLKDFELNLIKTHAPNCKIIDVRSLEPYYSTGPWTQYLKGKKVLVISPFVDSIEKQYEKRELLWQNKSVLPEFELKTLKHQLCPALGVPSEYDNWFEMVADMKRKISTIDFDVALIGTGGSSLPLAVHCKQLGKQSVHLGGALQILFGLKGTRWDNKPHISCFYNEHWSRVSGDEIPKKFKLNEGGCYW
jgi:hypothetical protein